MKTVKDFGKQVEYVYYLDVMKATPLIKISDLAIEIDMKWLEDCLVEVEKPD